MRSAGPPPRRTRRTASDRRGRCTAQTRPHRAEAAEHGQPVRVLRAELRVGPPLHPDEREEQDDVDLDRDPRNVEPEIHRPPAIDGADIAAFPNPFEYHLQCGGSAPSARQSSSVCSMIVSIVSQWWRARSAGRDGAVLVVLRVTTLSIARRGGGDWPCTLVRGPRQTSSRSAGARRALATAGRDPPRVPINTYQSAASVVFVSSPRNPTLPAPRVTAERDHRDRSTERTYRDPRPQPILSRRLHRFFKYPGETTSRRPSPRRPTRRRRGMRTKAPATLGS